MKKSKKNNILPAGPMRVLLEIHSILSYGGPLSAHEIAEKLDARGIEFVFPTMQALLSSVAADYFGICRLSGSNSFMIRHRPSYQLGACSTFKAEYPKGPVKWKHQAAIVHPDGKLESIPIKNRPRVDHEARKQEVLDFCKKHGRLPSQTIQEEKRIYNYINNYGRQDHIFMNKLLPYKLRGTKPIRESKDDIVELGMKLAKSGGGGSF